MDANGEARRPLLTQTLSAAERSVISHPPDNIAEDQDVEQGCVPVHYVTTVGITLRSKGLPVVFF